MEKLVIYGEIFNESFGKILLLRACPSNINRGLAPLIELNTSVTGILGKIDFRCV